MELPWPPSGEDAQLLDQLGLLMQRAGAAHFLDGPVIRSDERDFPEPWPPTRRSMVASPASSGREVLTEREVVVIGGLTPRALLILLAVQAVLREGPIEAHATLRPDLLDQLRLLIDQLRLVAPRSSSTSGSICRRRAPRSTARPCR